MHCNKELQINVPELFEIYMTSREEEDYHVAYGCPDCRKDTFVSFIDSEFMKDL